MIIAATLIVLGLLCGLVGYRMAKTKALRIIEEQIDLRQKDNEAHQIANSKMLNQFLELQNKHNKISEQFNQLFPPKTE